LWRRSKQTAKMKINSVLKYSAKFDHTHADD
jgi:hypothetical protein